MTTGQGLALSLAIAYTLAAALYLYARDLHIVNWRFYRKLRGGTWRHVDGQQVERFERRRNELAMSREWRRQAQRTPDEAA